jgi:hypothetical protein
MLADAPAGSENTAETDGTVNNDRDGKLGDVITANSTATETPNIRSCAASFRTEPERMMRLSQVMMTAFKFPMAESKRLKVSVSGR